MDSSVKEADLAASTETQEETVNFNSAAKIAEIRKNRVKSMAEAEGVEVEESEKAPSAPEDLETEAPEVTLEDSKESEEEEGGEEEKTDSSEIDVLSQIDFDAIDDETAKSLGKWFSESLGDKASAFFEGSNSGAGKDIGKLRGKTKVLAEEVDNLKAQLKEATSISRPNSGHFSTINTIEDLDTEVDKIEKTAKYWERKLYTDMESEFVGDKEVKGVRDETGKFFTADQILNYKDDLLEKLKSAPQRKQQILDAEKFLSSESEAVTKLKNDLFADDEESAKAFDQVVSNPKFGLIKQMFPEYAETLLESFAYAQLGRAAKPKKKTPIILPKKAKNKLATGDAGESTQTKGKNGRLRAINEALGGRQLNAKQRLALAREKRSILKNS